MQQPFYYVVLMLHDLFELTQQQRADDGMVECVSHIKNLGGNLASFQSFSEPIFISTHPKGQYLCLRVIGLLDAALPVASSRFSMREMEVPQGEKNLP